MNFNISPAFPTGSLFTTPPPLVLDSDPPFITTTQISPIQELVSTPNLLVVPPNNLPPFPIRYFTRLHKAATYLKDFTAKWLQLLPYPLLTLSFPLNLSSHTIISLLVIKL